MEGFTSTDSTWRGLLPGRPTLKELTLEECVLDNLRGAALEGSVLEASDSKGSWPWKYLAPRAVSWRVAR